MIIWDLPPSGLAIYRGVMGQEQQTVAIVGGGLSGALTAYHLAKSGAQVRVVVIEPRTQLGCGLAYSTTSMQHLLNVPAGQMSALPGEANHFLEWVRANYDADATAGDFIPRAIFGNYIQSLLAEFPEIEHLRASAIGYVPEQNRARLQLSDGSELVADAVVLATGNFDPPSFKAVNSASCHAAWSETTFRDLHPEAAILLIGTGLTAVDVTLKLREKGHRGIIRAVSRRAAFPHRHAKYTPLQQCALQGEAPRTARLLLRQVRNALKGANSWRAVIDSFRERANELWLALPPVEQERFRRHLLRRWELVRHRMAPPIADRIDQELAAGTLAIEPGRVEAIVPVPEGVAVRVQEAGIRRTIIAARAINCTGPDMHYRRVASPLLQSLLQQGLATDGPLGTGLWSNADGALRSQDGTFSQILFNIGPGRLGTLLESIAVPELRRQAADLAATLVVRLRASARTSVEQAA